MRVRLAAMALGTAAAVLAGCGGGGQAPAGPSRTAGGAAASSVPAGGPSTGTSVSASEVQVSATEFKLALSMTTFAPGPYTFLMRNDGSATHALVLEGPGVQGAESDTAGPGGSASLAATLQPGTYTLFCPVGNHRGLGMQTTFTVG